MASTTVTITHPTNRLSEIRFVRFFDGSVGITPTEEVTSWGDDVFDENDFLRALWVLYPDGLPKPAPEPLTKQEKQIRALTVFFMNGQRKDDDIYEPYTIDDYDEIMEYWDISGPLAREKAEKMLAVVESVEDAD